MDEDREPQRIEIELTTNEPRAVRRSPSRSADGHAGPDSTDADGRDGGPLGSERGRLVAVGTAAAVVALLAGVFLGRMAGPEVATSDSAPTTTEVPAPTTTRARDTDTLPRAPQVLSTTTTVPRGQAPISTDPEEPARGQIVVDPAAAISPVEVVALTNRGEIVRIDAATGRTVTVDVEGSQFGPPTIYAGGGWILIPSFDPVTGSIVLHDDGTRSTIDVGSAWPLLVDDEAATLWRGEPSDASGPPLLLRQIGIDGIESGPLIDLHGFYPQMADPLGGVVVQAPGGYFVLTPDGASRFTTGTLVALGRDRALVRECDERLECGYSVVDRATGLRTPLPLDPAIGDRVELELGWWSFRDPINPTGDAVLVSFWDQSGSGRQVFGVLDLSTGGFREIDEAGANPALQWAPDGRSLYWLDRGRLSVFDLDTGESVLFSDDLGMLNAFALRPASPSFDEPPASSLPGESADGG